MNKDILLRNEKIYIQYKSGVDIKTLSEKYNLKVSTIRKIISNHSKLVKQRDDFMDDLYKELKSKLKLNVATTIYNSIKRYLCNKGIYNIEEIKQVFESDTYIRNVGKTSKKIIFEYLRIEPNIL